MSERDVLRFLGAILLLACGDHVASAGSASTGPFRLVSVRTEAAAAEELLNAPSPTLAVGRLCFLGNAPPQGAAAVRVLVQQGDAGALLRALDAPTIEARLYARLGLFELGKLTRPELDEFAAQTSESVEACAGCFFGPASATAAVGNYLDEADIEWHQR
jgi:hypothetical protein